MHMIFLPFRMILVLLLLIFIRPSLALFVWARGNRKSWVLRFVTGRADADRYMYGRPRWKETRKIVYWRNKGIAHRHLGTNRYFVCEVTGYYSEDLGQFHVDHILPRKWWPLLAYDPKNLRLVYKEINIKKRDRLCGWSLFKFVMFKRIR